MAKGDSSVGVGNVVLVGMGVKVAVEVGEMTLPGVIVDTTDEFTMQPVSRRINVPVNAR
jgi:hypothetical protein